jgi:hypothetical protein
MIILKKLKKFQLRESTFNCDKKYLLKFDRLEYK